MRRSTVLFVSVHLRALLLVAYLLLAGLGAPSVAASLGIDDPLHGYYTATPRDRFARFIEDYRTGARQLDTSGDLPFLRSILKELDVPESSQMLVFSVTSLQKRLISPRRPRALYFNDDTYIGFVPGGQVEVISLDPDLGSIFYIFDRLNPGRPPAAERSDECMRCHAPASLQSIPALVIESVVPGMSGGGEKAFRRDRSGHDIPFDLRFGGWHVTGVPAGFPKHWGNLIVEYGPQGRYDRPVAPGELFDFSQYLRQTSDLLPHLLHEHQVGFVNRALQAAYRTRELLAAADKPKLDAELNTLAEGLVRYILFQDEAPLPALDPSHAAEFRSAFTQSALRNPAGASLRDLDLTSRLLRHRCSYMIYSPTFRGLPPALKTRVTAVLEEALREDAAAHAAGAHLAADEKKIIRQILAATANNRRAGD